MSTLEEWRRIRSGATRPQWRAMHPYPFLVSAPHAGTGEFSPLTKPTEFRTQTDAHRMSSAAPARAEEPLIMALRKAPGNPFPERISIGRAPNCDVVIRDPSISKLHGHFRDLTAESAVFSDARSSNGSRVDGNLVEAGAAVELHSRSLLVLGRVRLQVLSAIDVYDWL